MAVRPSGGTPCRSYPPHRQHLVYHRRLSHSRRLPRHQRLSHRSSPLISIYPSSASGVKRLYHLLAKAGSTPLLHGEFHPVCSHRALSYPATHGRDQAKPGARSNEVWLFYRSPDRIGQMSTLIIMTNVGRKCAISQFDLEKRILMSEVFCFFFQFGGIR
jgi:hypothetical protein